MALFSDVYYQAKALRDERTGWQARHPPDYQVMREIDDLKRIMDGLVSTFKVYGYPKTEEYEHVNGATPYYYYEGYKPGDKRIETTGSTGRDISLHPAGLTDH